MTAGAALVFLGSLVYLYVAYSWYNAGASGSAWLNAAQFLAPFVVAAAIFSTITLFFMGLGGLAGMAKGGDKMMSNVLWKFVMWGGMTFIILTGGTSWFLWAMVGLVLTYLGASWEMM